MTDYITTALQNERAGLEGSENLSLLNLNFMADPRTVALTFGPEAFKGFNALTGFGKSNPSKAEKNSSTSPAAQPVFFRRYPW